MANSKPHNLESMFEQAWPASEWRDLHVVMAVSGGPDSVAMLRAAASIKQRTAGRGRIYVAHLNHAVRGADADQDQAWLESLCDRLALPIEVGRADVAALATDQGDGWEAAARTARYDFLRRAAERLGARFVAVGHTADDQVETVLHRFLRGTGLAGLAGMPASRSLSPTVSLVRPLLAVSRRDVLQYLAAIDQDFRCDATNDDPRFTRNRLRHQLLPLMRSEFNADVDRAILRLAQQAGDSQQLIAQTTDELVARCASFDRPAAADGETRSATDVRIDCRPLAEQPPIVVREVCKVAWGRAGWPLQEMGFGQWQQLAELVADGAQPAIILPGGIRAERSGTTLQLRLNQVDP